MDTFNNLPEGKRYLIITLPLVISSFLLAICINERIHKKGHCGANNEQLCKEPIKKTVNGVDKYKCNGTETQTKKYSDYLKYTVIPINLIFIIINIIFLIFEFNKSSTLYYTSTLLKHISSFIIVFLIVVSILQIIFYYVYRKHCIDNNYSCNLVSILEDDKVNSENNNGYKIPKLICKNNLPKHTNYNYRISKNFNRIILTILVFFVIFYLYEIDLQYNLLGVEDSNKFSTIIGPIIFIICGLILAFVNIEFNGKAIQYVLNIIVSLLILFTLYIADYLNFIGDLLSRT